MTKYNNKKKILFNPIREKVKRSNINPVRKSHKDVFDECVMITITATIVVSGKANKVPSINTAVNRNKKSGHFIFIQ